MVPSPLTVDAAAVCTTQPSVAHALSSLLGEQPFSVAVTVNSAPPPLQVIAHPSQCGASEYDPRPLTVVALAVAASTMQPTSSQAAALLLLAHVFSIHVVYGEAMVAAPGRVLPEGHGAQSPLPASPPVW